MATSNEKPYRVLPVCLYLSEADAAERLTDILRRGGWPKANRSLVIREAVLRLDEELAGKPAEEIFRNFVDRWARRAGSAEAVHEAQQAAYERDHPDKSEAADARSRAFKDHRDDS